MQKEVRVTTDHEDEEARLDASFIVVRWGIIYMRNG